MNKPGENSEDGGDGAQVAAPGYDFVLVSEGFRGVPIQSRSLAIRDLSDYDLERLSARFSGLHGVFMIFTNRNPGELYLKLCPGSVGSWKLVAAIQTTFEEGFEMELRVKRKDGEY